jgi:hypothetical protein
MFPLSPHFEAIDSRPTQRFLNVGQFGLDVRESNKYSLALYFHDFDGRLVCPLGRLGASRPPAAGDGIPEEAEPRSSI